MIVRWVKLRFRKSEIPSFLENFEGIKEKIRHFEGCQFLELLQDLEDPTIFFTHSHWESQTALENYRNSDFFKEVWTETKQKFSHNPEAWSSTSLEKLDV